MARILDHSTHYDNRVLLPRNHNETRPDGGYNFDKLVTAIPTPGLPRSNVKRKQISNEEWLTLKPLLRQLYIVEKRKSRHIAYILAEKYNFSPTKRQLGSKFANWGFKKNICGGKALVKKEKAAKVVNKSLDVEEQVEQADVAAHVQLPRDLAGNDSINFDQDTYMLDIEKLDTAANSHTTKKPEHISPGNQLITISDYEDSSIFLENYSLANELSRQGSELESTEDVMNSPELLQLLQALKMESQKDIPPLELPPSENEDPNFIMQEDMVKICDSTTWNTSSGVSNRSSSLCFGHDTNLNWMSESRSGCALPFQHRADVFFPSEVYLPPSTINELYPFPCAPRERQYTSSSLTSWGKRRAQLDACTESLTKLHKVCFPQHKAIICLMEVQAAMYKSLLEPAKAETILRKLLNVVQQTTGPDSYDTLRITLRLAQALSSQFKFKQAIQLNGPNHQKIVSTLPIDHRLVLESLQEEAYLLQRTEQYVDGYKLCHYIIQIGLSSHGPKHLSTLEAFLMMSETMFYLNKHARNEQILCMVVQIYRDLPKDEKSQLTYILTMIELCDNFYEQGRTEELTQLSQAVVQQATTMLGPDHPKTVMGYLHLARSYELRGQFQEAVTMLRHTIERQDELLGKNHGNTYCTISHLGKLLLRLGRYEEATEVVENWYNGYRNWFSPESGHVFVAFECVAKAYDGQGRLEDTDSLYSDLLNAIPSTTDMEIKAIERLQVWRQARAERMEREVSGGILER